MNEAEETSKDKGLTASDVFAGLARVQAKYARVMASTEAHDAFIADLRAELERAYREKNEKDKA